MNTVRVALHMLNTRHFRKWEYMDCFTDAHLKLRLLMDEILHHFKNQVGEQSPRTPQLLTLHSYRVESCTGSYDTCSTHEVVQY